MILPPSRTLAWRLLQNDPDATTQALLKHVPDAVHAALTHPHSNGTAEGHVNRLKLLKRSSYGRARFELLRKKDLHQLA